MTVTVITEDDFVRVKKSPVLGVADILANVGESLQTVYGWREEDYDTLLECFAFLMEIKAAGLLDLPPIGFEITGHQGDDCTYIANYLHEVKTVVGSLKAQAQMEEMRERMRLGLGTQFSYEFTEGDLKRVNALLTELRELMVSSPVFPRDHKERLSKRFERLQAELNKRMRDLDKFYGLVGDVGVMLGKFENDAKPLVDRLREIIQIAWRTQSAAEELPSNSPPPELAGNIGKNLLA